MTKSIQKLSDETWQTYQHVKLKHEAKISKRLTNDEFLKELLK